MKPTENKSEVLPLRPTDAQRSRESGVVGGNSEVARIRQQIADEYEAAQLGLTGPAIVSRHDFIAARMEGIAQCHDDLVKLVGEQEAMELICDVNVKTVATTSTLVKTS